MGTQRPHRLNGRRVEVFSRVGKLGTWILQRLNGRRLEVFCMQGRHNGDTETTKV